MGESIGKITEAVMQFCRENMNILMISGAVLILLIIIIAVVLSARKDDDGDDLNFDEKEFIKEQNKETKEETSEANQPDTKMAVFRGGVESLLEEIAGLPAQTLKEIEIKIQGAEVKIKYAAAEDKPGDEQDKTFILKEDFKPPQPQKSKDTLYNLSIEDITKEIERAKAEHLDKTTDGKAPFLSETQTETCQEQSSKLSDDTIGHEQCECEKSGCEDVCDTTVRKFGPDNIDTTRSGRVFTEEELKEKIRD